MPNLVFCYGLLLKYDAHGHKVDANPWFFPVSHVYDVQYGGKPSRFGTETGDIEMLVRVRPWRGKNATENHEFLVPKKRLQAALVTFNGGQLGLHVDPVAEDRLTDLAEKEKLRLAEPLENDASDLI
jgi:hypothetical protein